MAILPQRTLARSYASQYSSFDDPEVDRPTEEEVVQGMDFRALSSRFGNPGSSATVVTSPSPGNISVSIGQVNASVAAEATIRATADSALATRASALEASVDTPSTGLLARVSTIETTYATDSEVSASVSSAISSEVTNRNNAIKAAGADVWTPVMSGGMTNLGGGSFRNDGSSGWTQHVYSSESYTGGAYVSFRAHQADKNFMVGLDSFPSEDASYGNIDYCFFCENGTNLYYYESGSYGLLSTYATTDRLSISYDGAYVRYYKNGSLLREVSASSGLTLYLDSSFNNAGAQVDDLRFGPIDTAAFNAKALVSTEASTRASADAAEASARQVVAASVASGPKRRTYRSASAPSQTNKIANHENLTGPGWYSLHTGTGSVATATDAGYVGPAGQRAFRIQANRGASDTFGDFSGWSSASVAVANPHPVVSRVWMKSNTGSTQLVYHYADGGVASVMTVTNEWQQFSVSNSNFGSAYSYIWIATRGSFGSSQSIDILVCDPCNNETGTPYADSLFEGDLWVDTTNGNAMKRWDGDSWEDTTVASGAISAAVTTEATARASADTALASSISTVSASVSTEVTDRTNADNTLQSNINTVSASVTTEATARASADGAIHARWGVNIDVNGRISGRINLDGTNASSTFLVAVDKFVVENANGTITAFEIVTGGKIVMGADVQSNNYSAGSTGWRIERTGNAEFNNVTVRGTLYSTAGTIGGFTLASNSFSAGSGGNKIEIASDVGTKGFGLRVGVTSSYTHHAEVDKNGITGFYYDAASDEGGFQLRNVDGTSGTNDGTLVLYNSSGNVRATIRAYDGYADFYTGVKVNGTQVLGAQGSAISSFSPSGTYGSDVSSLASCINNILGAMRNHGLIDT